MAPAYTSQRCSHSTGGYTHEDNRDGDEFECLECGKELHADYNAARNIGWRLLQGWHTSGAGGANCQVALKSGPVTANGDFTPATACGGQSGSPLTSPPLPGWVPDLSTRSITSNTRTITVETPLRTMKSAETGGEDGRRLGISQSRLPTAAVVIPTLGIVASETALYFGFLWYSLTGHLVTLLVCVLGPLVLTRELSMFQVFALVPVFRLVNLGMPVFFEFTVYWFPFVYAPLFPAMYLLLRGRDDLSLDFNLRGAGFGLVPGVFLAVVLAEFEYRIIAPDALITGWTIEQILLISVVMLLFVGLVEEILFRGILQRALEKRIGIWPGVLLASALFATMHSAYANVFEIIFAGVIGLLFGVIYIWTKSIIIITVIHGVLNILLFGYLPLHGSFVETPTIQRILEVLSGLIG